MEEGYSLHPEDPSPRGIVCDDAAQNGTEKAGDSDHHAYKTSDPGSHLRGTDFDHDDHGEGVETRATHALQCSASNKLAEGLREPAAQGEANEDDEGTRESIPPSNHISDAGKYDGAAHVGERIGEGYPRDVRLIVEITADNVEGGGYDRGVY